MTIAEAREKCKNLIVGLPRDVLIVGILILASSLSFGLGYLAGSDKGGASTITVETLPLLSSTATTTAGQVVASKNGTKYYLPSCSGADRISTANKIWFASSQAAVTAGYAPAANCKGI